MVDTTTSCAGHPEWCNGDQSGSGREPDYVINVHCNGSMGAVGLESVSCAVPAQAIDGSAPYFEVYPPMAQGLIQGNAKLWRDSTGAVERLAIGTVAAAAGPLVSGELPTAGTMNVAFGANGEGGIHFAFGANGQWVHAIDFGEEAMMVVKGGAETFAKGTRRSSVPVFNPYVVVPAIGTAATNCFTAACAAFIRGWTF